MKYQILYIAAAFFILIIILRNIYRNHILPAHLAGFPWYTQYLQIESEAKNIHSLYEYRAAWQLFCQFRDDLTIKDCYEYRQAINRLGKIFFVAQRKCLSKLKAC